jgi:NADH dehydrogenase
MLCSPGRGLEVGEILERVLVTGANGHLGRRLIERLLVEERAGAVQAVVRSERAAALLEPLAGHGLLDVSIVDPADATALATSCESCSHAVHLAGILKETSASRYVDAHERTSEALVAALEKSGVKRIVYLSILGARADSENRCLASKGRAEEILRRGKVPAVVLRVPMVLGRGDVAARVLAMRASAAFVPLPRGGASLEQPIDVGDAVEAILRALIAQGLDGADLDLAGPESLTRRDLVLRAAAILGRPPPRIVSVPLPLVHLGAFLAETLFANPPLTPPMLGVLEHDDCIDPLDACRRLGLELTPLCVTLRRCLLDAERA